MPERPKPDMDLTREALRRHDEREREDEEREAEPDEGEEKEPPAASVD
jgi:hypothetical protein